jgi:hypothetical protein
MAIYEIKACLKVTQVAIEDVARQYHEPATLIDCELD